MVYVLCIVVHNTLCIKPINLLKIRLFPSSLIPFTDLLNDTLYSFSILQISSSIMPDLKVNQPGICSFITCIVGIFFE